MLDESRVAFQLPAATEAVRVKDDGRVGCKDSELAEPRDGMSDDAVVRCQSFDAPPETSAAVRLPMLAASSGAASKSMSMTVTAAPRVERSPVWMTSSIVPASARLLGRRPRQASIAACAASGRVRARRPHSSAAARMLDVTPGVAAFGFARLGNDDRAHLDGCRRRHGCPAKAAPAPPCPCRAASRYRSPATAVRLRQARCRDCRRSNSRHAGTMPRPAMPGPLSRPSNSTPRRSVERLRDNSPPPPCLTRLLHISVATSAARPASSASKPSRGRERSDVAPRLRDLARVGDGSCAATSSARS